MDTGTFRLGRLEAQYGQLFAEAMREGNISPEDRERLDRAAAILGLRSEDVAHLEAALRSAGSVEAHRTPRDTLADSEDPGIFIDSTRSVSVSVESTGRERAISIMLEQPAEEVETQRDSRAVPQTREQTRDQTRNDIERLHQRYAQSARVGDTDKQWSIAAVLSHRKAATFEEADFYQAHRTGIPPRPRTPLTLDGWDLLFHPEEDSLTREIFAVIAPASLLGRIAAMRADRTLVHVDPRQRHDPEYSTVSAVRAIAWSAATLGLVAPPIFVAPELDTGLEVIANIPPASRVGARMLSGQSTTRLAFQAARHVTWFRRDHFVCTLVPTIADLADLFIAALSLGAPELDLRADVLARASLIADAISPVLEAAQLARLRDLVSQFVAKGGRTDLQTWARAAGFTAGRAGALLSGDLEVACELAIHEPSGEERVRDLEQFFASDAASELRGLLGISVT